MANPTTYFGWVMPTATDLVTDLPADFNVFGQGVDTSMQDLLGGTTGQVLSKTSATNMDFTWVTPTDQTPLTTKGDLFTFTTVDARLAVGNNGQSLFADSAEATGLKYNTPVASLVNPVINGGMDNWQRGTSISVTASTTPYTADRWQVTNGASQALTVSRQATGDTTNLPNIQYAARVQRNSGQTGTSAIAFVQSFETTNSIPFAGKAVTLSFYARKGADYSASPSTIGIDFISGTGTDQNRATAGYTGNANVFSSAATLTTSWQRFVFTGTVAATATELATYFIFNPTGTAGTNDYFELTGVQIDLGTWTATTVPTFRRTGGSIQGELAACQRYYYRAADSSSSYGSVGLGMASSSTASAIWTQFPVSMRVKPTSVDFSTLILSDSVGTITVTTLTIDSNVTSISAGATQVSGTGQTQYRPMYLRQNASSGGYIGFSAEL